MSCVLAQLVHHHDPFPQSPSFVSTVCKLNGVVLLPVPARTTTTMSLHSVSFARAVLLKASSFCLTRSLLVVCPCLRCCMLVLNRGKTTVDIQVVNYVFFLSLVCRLAWGSNQPFLCCWVRVESEAASTDAVCFQIVYYKCYLWKCGKNSLEIYSDGQGLLKHLQRIDLEIEKFWTFFK